MMKKENIFVFFVLGLLFVAIIALSTRNDYRFNEERCNYDCKVVVRDSLLLKQIDRGIVLLNDMTVVLDSIQNTQKEYSEKEIQNIDTLKTHLFQIKKTSQKMLNLIK